MFVKLLTGGGGCHRHEDSTCRAAHRARRRPGAVRVLPAGHGRHAREAVATLASLFTALADPSRVKILSMLLNDDDVCACDVATGIGKSAATTSHHLNVVRTGGLVADDRRGTWVYYRVRPEGIGQLREALRPLFPA